MAKCSKYTFDSMVEDIQAAIPLLKEARKRLNNYAGNGSITMDLAMLEGRFRGRLSILLALVEPPLQEVTINKQ